ncbi:MAG: MFS transporter [Deltaproteobacteria bacterium]|nr:MFS transporter [Deltaproteobacteria bacterium]
MRIDQPTPVRPSAVLAVVCAATFLGVLNASAVNVVLPEMGSGLAVEPALLGWVISLFLLVYGVAIPFYGRLAERFGTITPKGTP